MLNIRPDDIQEEKKSGTAPLVEQGVYPAVISLIMDCGIQKNKKFDSRHKADEACTDKDYDIQHELWFSFTLPTERYEVELEDGTVEERDQILGKAMKVSKDDRANLQKMYTAVVKDKRTYGEMLGMPVTVTTGLTDGGKAKITNIAAPMRGTQVGEPLRPNLLVDEDSWKDVDNLDLPDFLKEKIKNRVQ